MLFLFFFNPCDIFSKQIGTINDDLAVVGGCVAAQAMDDYRSTILALWDLMNVTCHAGLLTVLKTVKIINSHPQRAMFFSTQQSVWFGVTKSIQ